MSPAQTELLLRLIDAERRHARLVERGEHPDWAWRGVEVGGLSGIRLSTARSLEKAGLVELVAQSRYLVRAFLGSYAEYRLPGEDCEESGRLENRHVVAKR